MRHLLRLSSGREKPWLCLGISSRKGCTCRKPAAAVAPVHWLLVGFNLHNLQGLGGMLVAAGVCTSNKAKGLPVWGKRCHCCRNIFPTSIWGPEYFVCTLPSQFSFSKPSTAVLSASSHCPFYDGCTPAPSLLEPQTAGNSWNPCLWKQTCLLWSKIKMLFLPFHLSKES